MSPIRRPPSSVAVIGAGLTGLTAAYRLSQVLPSARVTLIDAAKRTGGWVETTRHPVAFDAASGRQEGEIVLEGGPRSIRPRGLGAPAMLKLIHDLDLGPSVLPIPQTHPAAKYRYLVDPDTWALTLLETSPRILQNLGSRAVRNLVLGVASEPFRPRGTRAASAASVGGPESPLDPFDESVDSFFTRRFGANMAATASAMVHGIYAADPAALSVRSAFGMLVDAERRAGSVVLGMLRGKPSPDAIAEAEGWKALGDVGEAHKDWSMYALRGGMGTLTDALEREVRRTADVRLGEGVERLVPGEEGVELTTPHGTSHFDHVIAALPSRHLSPLLSSPLPHLCANSATTVGVVNVVYSLPPSEVHPTGFGYLIPRGGQNPEGALGVIFDSTALPGGDIGVEAQVTKLTVMMGGPHWSSYPHSDSSPLPRPTEAELAPLALAHLHRVFPHLAQIQPLLVNPHLRAECIPTYAPGHGARLRALDAAVRQGPWDGRLTLAGAGYGGVSVNDVVYAGEGAAGCAREGGTGLERWRAWE